MNVTKSMMLAARRAEFDYYQKGRLIGAHGFIPTPDEVIKAMLEAALKLGDVPAPGLRKSGIVTASAPGKSRK